MYRGLTNRVGGVSVLGGGAGLGVETPWYLLWRREGLGGQNQAGSQAVRDVEKVIDSSNLEHCRAKQTWKKLQLKIQKVTSCKEQQKSDSERKMRRCQAHSLSICQLLLGPWWQLMNP